MERFYSDGGGSSDSSSYPELHYNSSSPAALDAPGNTGRNGGVKYCGVCGDVAKSYHFGGLSCDSCKAFFRRSVQNDNYLHFQCCHRGQCTISLSNRKSCQFCRMKRCFGIGMEKSWVMTEEERKALMKARAEKKSCKKTSISSSSSSSLSAASPHNQNSSSSSGGDQSPGMASTSAAPANEYEPQIERMIDFLSPLEIKEIESIVTKYMHAYQHVPYRTELRFYDSDRPGVQVMEVRISTSIYRWSGGKPNLGMRFTEFFLFVPVILTWVNRCLGRWSADSPSTPVWWPIFPVCLFKIKVSFSKEVCWKCVCCVARWFLTRRPTAGPTPTCPCTKTRQSSSWTTLATWRRPVSFRCISISYRAFSKCLWTSRPSCCWS